MSIEYSSEYLSEYLDGGLAAAFGVEDRLRADGWQTGA